MKLLSVVNGLAEFNNGNTDYVLTIKSYSKIEILGKFNMKIEYVNFDDMSQNIKTISMKITLFF